MHAAEHHDAQLVGDSLRYMEPVQLGVQEPRQATVKLVCTADHSNCGVQHSLHDVLTMETCLSRLKSDESVTPSKRTWSWAAMESRAEL